MASFSILHFSYIFAPWEMELRPGLPSLGNFPGWIQENDDRSYFGTEKTLIQLSDVNFFGRRKYLPLSTIFRWQQKSTLSQPDWGGRRRRLSRWVPQNLQSPKNSSTKLPSSHHLACWKAINLARK